MEGTTLLHPPFCQQFCRWRQPVKDGVTDDFCDVSKLDGEAATKVLVVASGGTMIFQPRQSSFCERLEQIHRARPVDGKIWGWRVSVFVGTGIGSRFVLPDGLFCFHVCSLSNTPEVCKKQNRPKQQGGHLSTDVVRNYEFRTSNQNTRSDSWHRGFRSVAGFGLYQISPDAGATKSPIRPPGKPFSVS
jgi:hypothetical protein